MKSKLGKMVQLAGMFKRLSETNQNDFGLEEHFWARPSSSKVGTDDCFGCTRDVPELLEMYKRY